MELRDRPALYLPEFLADDVTPEALAELLDKHGNIVVTSTEGGLFPTLGGRYANGIPNLDLVNKSYSGEAAKVARANGKRLDIPRPTLTISMAVQPRILIDMSASAIVQRSTSGRFAA